MYKVAPSFLAKPTTRGKYSSSNKWEAPINMVSG